MAVYTKYYNQWKNKPDKTTPATADAMNHIENGIVSVSQHAERSFYSLSAAQEDQQTVIDGFHYRKPTIAGRVNDEESAGTLIQPNSYYATPDTIREVLEAMPSGGEGSAFNEFSVSAAGPSELAANPQEYAWTVLAYLDISHQNYIFISAINLGTSSGVDHGAIVIAPATGIVDPYTGHKKLDDYCVGNNWLKNVNYGDKQYNDIIINFNGVEYKLYHNSSYGAATYQYEDWNGNTVAYANQAVPQMYYFDETNPLIPDGLDLFNTSPDSIKIEKYIPPIVDLRYSYSTTYSSQKIENMFNEMSQQLYSIQSDIRDIKYRTGLIVEGDIYVESEEDPQTYEPTGDVTVSVMLNGHDPIRIFQSVSTDSDHLVYNNLTATATIGGHTVTCTLTPPSTVTDDLVIEIDCDGDTTTFNVKPYDGEHTYSGYSFFDGYHYDF